MIDLKHCPFCGSKGNNIVVVTDKRTDRTDCNFTSRVSCLNCFGGIHTHGFYWTAEEAQTNAIQAWNRRYYDRDNQCNTCV